MSKYKNKFMVFCGSGAFNQARPHGFIFSSSNPEYCAYSFGVNVLFEVHEWVCIMMNDAVVCQYRLPIPGLFNNNSENYRGLRFIRDKTLQDMNRYLNDE
jgi:hypothetical protein